MRTPCCSVSGRRRGSRPIPTVGSVPFFSPCGTLPRFYAVWVCLPCVSGSPSCPIKLLPLGYNVKRIVKKKGGVAVCAYLQHKQRVVAVFRRIPASRVHFFCNVTLKKAPKGRPNDKSGTRKREKNGYPCPAFYRGPFPLDRP